MSNTKGSMLISNANAVGTELVNQLGGTGYKPSEWSDAINLLGISDDDKASALAGITEGTYTGTERGAIKYSNCNAVGSMLNKKFSTDRGFKPVEWESAISKLTPLAEGTVSGAICNIVNGAEDVPLKNWLVTLPASLDGYSSVTAYKAKKNLWEFGDKTVNATYIMLTLSTPLPAGTYTISAVISSTYTHCDIRFRKEDGSAITSRALTASSPDRSSGTVTLSEPAYRIYLYSSRGQAGHTATWNDIQIEVGSTPTQYTAYSAPTQYTASLGRTIYGGTADIVTGEGEATYKGYNLGSLTWTGGIIDGQMWCWYCDLSADGLKLPTNSNIFDGICDDYTPIRFNGVSSNANTIALRSNGVLYVNNGSDTIEPTGNVTIAFDTPSTFTFTPITPTPETPLGVSNWWSDNGDSTITYRKDPDIPDPPVQLLNMNNNENNNNEGV